MENDTVTGGEELTIDQAATAYAKLSTPQEVQQDQSEVEDDDESEMTDDELQASDEDTGEDDEGETEVDDQAEEGDEGEEPESEQGRFVADNAKVKLSDGTVTTIAELKKGSLLNADYTRKTQEVAEQRRSVESQSERIAKTEQELEQRQEYVVTLLKSIVPPAPNPSMADPRNPDYDLVGYMAAKTQHDEWVQYLSHMEQEQQRLTQERQAKSEAAKKEVQDREWNALLEKVPEFSDQKRIDRFVTDIKEHSTAYGIKPEELVALAMDHRQALVMRDAIAWRKLQASKATVAKKVEGRPPVQKGGKRLSPDGHKARRASDAISRLQSSGSERDAVAAYLAMQKG